MKQIKTFMCDDKVPSTVEINTAIILANMHSCIIELKWFYPCNGWHNVFIHPGMVYKDVEAKLPKRYAV